MPLRGGLNGHDLAAQCPTDIENAALVVEGAAVIGGREDRKTLLVCKKLVAVRHLSGSWEYGTYDINYHIHSIKECYKINIQTKTK